MDRVRVLDFFHLCVNKESFQYMGRNAIALFSECDGCFFITQYEDECWESIYEDQIEAVYKLKPNEFLILDDCGQTSIVSFS